jgi:hypothetical protein
MPENCVRCVRIWLIFTNSEGLGADTSERTCVLNVVRKLRCIRFLLTLDCYAASNDGASRPVSPRVSAGFGCCAWPHSSYSGEEAFSDEIG